MSKKTLILLVLICLLVIVGAFLFSYISSSGPKTTLYPSPFPESANLTSDVSKLDLSAPENLINKPTYDSSLLNDVSKTKLYQYNNVLPADTLPAINSLGALFKLSVSPQTSKLNNKTVYSWSENNKELTVTMPDFSIVYNAKLNKNVGISKNINELSVVSKNLLQSYQLLPEGASLSLPETAYINSEGGGEPSPTTPELANSVNLRFKVLLDFVPLFNKSSGFFVYTLTYNAGGELIYFYGYDLSFLKKTSIGLNLLNKNELKQELNSGNSAVYSVVPNQDLGFVQFNNYDLNTISLETLQPAYFYNPGSNVLDLVYVLYGSATDRASSEKVNTSTIIIAQKK